MGVFKQLGSLIGRTSSKIKPIPKYVRKQHEAQEAAYAEMEKEILAPVIREDSRKTLSEEEIDNKIQSGLNTILKYYDGKLHKKLFDLSKEIRLSIKNENRIITLNNPIYIA